MTTPGRAEADTYGETAESGNPGWRGAQLVPVAPKHLATPLTADRILTRDTAASVLRSQAANTTRAYRRWWTDFVEWCAEAERTPVPATAETLAEYVYSLGERDLSGSSIRQAIAAIRARHALEGYEDQPPMRLAKRVLRTHLRERADDGARGKQATPIVIDALRRMVDTCNPDSLRGRRDRLVLVLGWAGMLRRSELAALLDRDVTITSDGLTVFIPRSKTDKDAAGHTIAIPRGSHPETDPVRVLERYREALAWVERGRLIRGIESGGRLLDQISADAINDIVKEAARRAQLPGADGYSAHSLRAGGATAAYMAGVPVATIAQHGRWAPNSPVVLGYIRAVDRWRDNAMRNVGL